jgi:hypothetical protein
VELMDVGASVAMQVKVATHESIPRLVVGA